MAVALLLAALLQSPASVTVPQLSETQRGGAASVVADSPSLATTSSKAARADLAAAPTQLGDSGRTAEPAPALSTRAQGRSVSASAVGGRDRCDPTSAAAQSELCRRRLETRSGEYANTGAAPVTAEGRLMILTDPQRDPQTLDAATRRLGTPGVDALAGSAASELAGAINAMRTDPGASTTVTPPSGSTTALPPGVPSTVVLTPH